MPDKVVQVPGVGVISFPDSMSDDDISKAISSHMDSQPKAEAGFFDKANEYAGKALSGAGLPTSLGNIPDWFKHLTGQAKDSEPFWTPIRRAIANPTQENLVAAVPFIGPSSVAMSKDVQAGNYGGAAATLAGTVAGPLAGGEVKPGLAAAKQTAADFNQLANKVVDRTAPHSLVASAVKEVLPQPKPTPNFYGGAYSDYYGESPKEWPLAKSPTMTGDAAAAYRAGRKGVSLQEMAAQQAAKEGTGINVVPEPRGNFSGEVPGYMASVPRGTLEDLALAAKPGAGVQLQQLGRPILYEPRGAGISNVKSSVSLSDMAAVPPRGQEIYLRPNASGESGASLEAINRSAGESAIGARRIKIDTRSGNEIPLIGPDAVDAKAGPYDEIVMRDRNGNETVLDRGQRALTRRSRR